MVALNVKAVRYEPLLKALEKANVLAKAGFFIITINSL
jgi:hypothetical protein